MKRLGLFLLLIFAALSVFAGDLKIVFIGNSITYGAHLEDKVNDAPPVKAAKFISELTGRKVEFRNCGVSGKTTLDFLPITGTHFPKVVAAARELIAEGGKLLFTISLGTNDSASSTAFGAPVVKEGYYTNMKAIVDELLQLFPDCKVVIQQPIWYSPNTYNKARYLKAGLERLQTYFPMIPKLVEHYAEVCPGHVFMGDTEAFAFFRDNFLANFTPENGNAGVFYLHPNREGAEILARYWAKAIVKAITSDATK